MSTLKLRWSDERVERLKELAALGMSAAQIAAELDCGATRNAVIGKMARLGVVKTKTLRKVTIKNAPTKITLPKSDGIAPLSAFVRTQHAPKSDGISLMELNSQTCRWPNGDVGAPGFSFCGDEPLDGKPYCASHSRIAYRKPGEMR